jgi:predicted HicB family RNase H-like nuclease
MPGGKNQCVTSAVASHPGPGCSPFAACYSGKILLRVAPEVHARAALTAEAQGKSLNQWAAEVLARAN